MNFYIQPNSCFINGWQNPRDEKLSDTGLDYRAKCESKTLHGAEARTDLRSYCEWMENFVVWMLLMWRTSISIWNFPNIWWEHLPFETFNWTVSFLLRGKSPSVLEIKKIYKWSRWLKFHHKIHLFHLIRFSSIRQKIIFVKNQRFQGILNFLSSLFSVFTDRMMTLGLTKETTYDFVRKQYSNLELEIGKFSELKNHFYHATVINNNAVLCLPCNNLIGLSV